MPPRLAPPRVVQEAFAAAKRLNSNMSEWVGSRTGATCDLIGARYPATALPPA